MRLSLILLGAFATSMLGAACDSDELVDSEDPPRIENLEPEAGPTAGAVPITIMGQNFGAASSVTFSETEAEVTSATDRQILVQLPEGEGSVDVQVESGGVSSDPAAFTYFPPSIDLIEPVTGTTAGGLRITIMGDNFGLSPEVTLQDQPAEIETSDHSELVVITPPGNPGSASVRVTVGGQTSNSAEFTYQCPPGQVEKDGVCVDAAGE